MNKTTSKRLLALDILRGITIAGMIMVNNPGSWSYVYAPLGHAQWNGLTPISYSPFSCLSWEYLLIFLSGNTILNSAIQPL